MAQAMLLKYIVFVDFELELLKTRQMQTQNDALVLRFEWALMKI